MAIETVTARLLKQDGNSAASTWSGAFRNGQMLNVENGDVLEMPASLEDCKGKIVVHENLNNAQSIVVKAKTAAGIDKEVEFWPNSVCRSLAEFKPARVPGDLPVATGRRPANDGAVVDDLINCIDVAEAMGKLYGKKLLFTLREEVVALRYGTKDTYKAKIWTITYA